MVEKPTYQQLEARLKSFEAKEFAHRRAHEVLLESDERFRIIAETSKDMIHLNDRQRRIIYANLATEKLLGHPLAKILNRPAAELVHPDDREKVLHNMETVLSGQTVSSVEVRLLKSDGDYLQAEASGFVVDLGDGKKYMGAIIRDISDRKRAEAQLLSYREQLEAQVGERTKRLDELLVFSNNLAQARDLRDMYRTVTNLSKKFLRFDFSTLMILSGDKSRLVQEDTIGTFFLVQGQGLSTHVVKAKKPAMVVDFKEESRFDVPPIVFEKQITSALCVPMMVGAEVFGVLIGHTHDKRHFADDEVSFYQSVANQAAFAIKNFVHLESLHQSERKFRAFVDQAADAFFVTNVAGRLVDVNRRACESLGYSREELLAMDVYDIDPEAGKQEHKKNLWKKLSPGHPLTVQAVHQRKDGSTFPVEVRIGMLDMGGEPFLMGLARDISSRKRLENEMFKAQKLESLGILAGGIAHDFNNLLAAILGNVSLAKECAKSDKEIFALLDDTEKASLRARKLTRQLLTFSKGGTPVMKTAAIKEIVEESAKFSLRGSNIKWFFDLPDDLWSVEVDEGQISQVVQNLATNADQAMPEGGAVHITAANICLRENEVPPLPADNYVKISVKDEGPGIPEENLGRIFDPYFTTKEQGSGLGLAVCYSIIKNHKGHVTVESTSGAGAIFYFYLPASAKAFHLEGGLQEPVMGAGKILVMDDEPMVRDVAEKVLCRLGYDADLACDGREAVDMYQKAREDGVPYDAVIMDLTIPGGMGGKEAVKEILAIDPAARVIVSSGYASDKVMADYHEYGFCGVVPKPYDLYELSVVLHEVIKNGE